MMEISSRLRQSPMRRNAIGSFSISSSWSTDDIDALPSHRTCSKQFSRFNSLEVFLLR